MPQEATFGIRIPFAGFYHSKKEEKEMRTWIWEGKEKEKRYRIQKFWKAFWNGDILIVVNIIVLLILEAMMLIGLLMLVGR